jgi:heme exporter protein A
VSLAVPAGRVQLVVGPNGCGKSTLARLAAGLLKASKGTVRVERRDPRIHAAARRRIGLVAHQSLLYDDLTPRENLEFTARLYGLADAKARIDDLLDRLVIGRERDVAVRRLSRGMTQRAALARALLHDPTLLILDEPFTGLDAPSVARLVALLDAAREHGAALLVVSHDLGDVWRLPAAVAVLHQGRIAFSGETTMPIDAFRARYAAILDG